MAQLAHCPACNCEVALPEEMAAGETLNRRVQCPECDAVFAAADAKPHEVKQVKLIDVPTTVEESAARSESEAVTDEVSADQPAAPKFSSATLASFLGEPDRTGEESDEPTSSEAAAAPKLPSLDELIGRRPSTFGDRDTPKEADSAGEDIGEAETVEFDTPVDEQPGLDASTQPPEPSPVADRLRHSLDELLGGKGDSPADDESGSYDPVEEVAEDEAQDRESDQPASTFDEPVSPTSFESTLRDLGETTDTEVADAPSFDFEVGGTEDLEGSKSLRAAMGFGGDEPLEVEQPVDRPDFASIETSDDEQPDSPELNFGGSDVPRGVVATRKRSGVAAFARTMIGVAGGGVLGIAAGYLLLLWIFHFIGRTDEPLALAQYYPDVLKPAAFREDAGSVSPEIDGGDPLAMETPDSAGDLEPIDDAEVAPASFDTESPIVADEPLPWEFEAQPVPPVVIEGAPNYTAAELQQLTALADDASPGLLAGSFDDAAARPVKGGSYAKIAQLAEALTFGEGASDVSWKNHARDVFPPLFATEQSRQEISLIASYWITSSKRRHGGVFFCGTPDAGRQSGAVAEYEFSLPGGQKLTVLTPRAMTDATTSASSVVVVGSVVDDPASRINGYTGEATQAIWSADLFPLGD